MTCLNNIQVKVMDFEIKLLKFFRSLNLNFKMDLVDTLPVVRYWSEILNSTVMTNLRDLGVKGWTLKFRFRISG